MRVRCGAHTFATFSLRYPRRHALLGLQRKEALWRAVATERVKSDLQAEHADLEERDWERVAQQGPDVQAMEKVALVRGGEEVRRNCIFFWCRAGVTVLALGVVC